MRIDQNDLNNIRDLGDEDSNSVAANIGQAGISIINNIPSSEIPEHVSIILTSIWGFLSQLASCPDLQNQKFAQDIKGFDLQNPSSALLSQACLDLQSAVISSADVKSMQSVLIPFIQSNLLDDLKSSGCSKDNFLQDFPCASMAIQLLYPGSVSNQISTSLLGLYTSWPAGAGNYDFLNNQTAIDTINEIKSLLSNFSL